MKTPIVDFCRKYSSQNVIRAHMPGHKGVGSNGENVDLTEINGADSLYTADGIIKESENNASSLFSCPTFYSTEGSSQCIRAMLHLVSTYAKKTGRPLKVCAGRNVHRSFTSACALLDLEVIWHYGKDSRGILGCDYDINELKKLFESENKPVALYVTSPDYLGNVAPIKEISELCHDNGVLLVVDNAHGAYLKFMPTDTHPITLGADLCCDSAHKTLPVLTGGAYLHVSASAPEVFVSEAKNALALFGSTSPSYLILQSLDRCNSYLEGLNDRLSTLVTRIDELKCRLTEQGYVLAGEEALKITVLSKFYGYRGEDFADICEKNGLYLEFADPDHAVLMLTDENREDLNKIAEILLSIPKREPINESMPIITPPVSAMSIREATLSPSKTVKVCDSVGMIATALTVGCPPAVPIVVSGEIITENAVKAFEYYGIKTVSVLDCN